ncbi:MAG: hypothetical protein QM619_04885 [Micropruina sp.]|uniref:hypothetical protein n=1 Tax=Micropruina sp. TaxID=2737536 RepID=UPI0039E477F4
MLFATEEWFAAWVDAANADDRFRAAGVGWKGSVGLVVLGRVDTFARLDGAEGRWTTLAVGTAPVLVEGTTFTISADAATWRELVEQRLDPLRALIVGRARIRGQLSAILARTTALRVMTAIAGGLDTTFVESAGP